jgi:hypothetical protein
MLRNPNPDPVGELGVKYLGLDAAHQTHDRTATAKMTVKPPLSFKSNVFLYQSVHVAPNTGCCVPRSQ